MSKQPRSTGSADFVTRAKALAMWGLVAALATLVIVGVAMGVRRMGQSEADGSAASGPATYPVSRQSFDLTVIAAGELEAKRKIDIKCEVEGQTTIVEIIPEGTAVKAGDVLVQLAAEEIEAKIEQETLNAERALADKIAAEQALAIQESEAESNIKAAQLKLELAQLDLAKWEKGTDPQQQRERALALEKAKRNLVRYKRDLELSRQLYAEKFISQGELEDDEIRVLEAEAALETAQLEISVYASYSRPKEIKKAASDVEQAAAELVRTNHKNLSDLERLRADLISKDRTHRIRDERLTKLKEQLAKTTIRAPEDGLVVYATSVGPGSRRAQPMAQGRVVRLGESLLLLPDTRQMIASLKVNEALVAQVAADQRVALTIDARPGQYIPAKVYQIGVMAEDGGWLNPDLREYVVRVDLPEGADDSLKPGMRCSGEIVIGRVEDALAVPVQAVFVEGEETFCYVRSALRTVERRIVTMGRASESLVEITDGLSEGETVLLRRPRPDEMQAKL